ncbi:MAG TPA: molybdopterin oxidoreductase family protein [Dehalococcoidia bacterium]|nr:molybdopterin oxidoreductase family protein [Dehalococcoidia bacterium]
MTVNRDTFVVRDFNYDFQQAGRPAAEWSSGERADYELVPTHCCFCGVQCGMNMRVSEGRVVGVEPRDYVHNRGALCPKGVVAYQQADHPDRILHPLMRRGGKQGALERASWDEALDYITERWRRLQAENGRDSVAVYSGSSMTNEKCYVAGKFGRVALGTRHVDYNGRLCMSSAAGAYSKAFGIDRSPLPIPDYALSDCILAVGTNVAECFPIVMQWIWQARDHGAKLIVVDPRETPAARTADLWLPIRSGTDVALLNCMLRQVIKDGLVDEDYVRERTNGWDEVRAEVEGYTPESVEPIVGIPAERIVAAARIYAHASRSLIMHARGIEHSTHGVNNCLAAINLALARGQVGKPGGGVTMLTGQGNGQGGREMGQKAAQLPGYRHIDDPDDRRFIASVWGIDEADLPGEGAAAPEMIHLMANGEIKSGLVMCSNPMVSLPDNSVVKSALLNLEPLVVVDFFMSETAELADVVLPGSIWLEDEGTTTNLEGRVIKLNIAQHPAGESRPDWWILTELARRLGKGQYFPYESAADIWQELRRATAGGIADYSGITWERIEREQGVFWPCPSEDHPGSEHLFAERFAHPDGRARFHAIEYAPPVEEPNEAYPFRLTSGRVVYQYLSGNQTRRLGFLNSQAPEPWVEVHPSAAEKAGIRDGDVVRVRTPRKHMTLKVLITPTIRPDTLFIPFHYGHEEAVNQLTNPAVEPEVKIPEYKASAAALERIDAPLPETSGRARENETPESAPEKFPYSAGEVRNLTRSH